MRGCRQQGQAKPALPLLPLNRTKRSLFSKRQVFFFSQMPTEFTTNSLLSIYNAARENMGHFSHMKKTKGVISCYRNRNLASITSHGNEEIPLLKLPLESSWVTTPLSTDYSVSKLHGILYQVQIQHGRGSTKLLLYSEKGQELSAAAF